MIRVAVAIGSPPLRLGVERALAQRASMSIISTPSGNRGLALDADVVIVDAAEWQGDAGAHAAPPVIVLSDAPREIASAVLRAGAAGVLPYDADATELAAAVEAVAAGLVVLPAEPRSAPVPGRGSRRDGGQGREATGHLTEREREVLALLANGLPNRAIGERLGISEHTVKTYVTSILEKLDASTRAEAVAIGLRRGLVML